jgi:hypothetical protein
LTTRRAKTPQDLLSKHLSDLMRTPELAQIACAVLQVLPLADREMYRRRLHLKPNVGL